MSSLFLPDNQKRCFQLQEILVIETVHLLELGHTLFILKRVPTDTAGSCVLSVHFMEIFVVMDRPER